MKSQAVTLIALLLVAILGACGETESAVSSDVRVTLEPAPPGETYLVAIVTAADGQPLTGAAVALEGNMNHAGMVPVFSESVHDEADGALDGRYRVPFEFTMLGDWIVTVTVTQPEGVEAKTNIDLTVSDSGVTVK